MKIDSKKWIEIFLTEAYNHSKKSKDPSTQTGATIIGIDGEPLSNGYNGFPRGVIDLPERYANRELKYKLVEHAERNAIYNASRVGTRLKGSSLYVFGLPVCNECAKGIIQAGISHVYCAVDPTNPRSNFWAESTTYSSIMFEEANVTYDRFTFKIEKDHQGNSILRFSPQ